ncbi:MAG: hypothetical protein ACJ8CR_36370 [Roseiflexaceae bacterium]
MTLLDTAQPRTSPASDTGATADDEAHSRRFDWLMALTSLWILTGTFLDGWYHNTFQDGIETFFTPWHGILYSGLAAAGALLLPTYARNLGRGYTWMRALPSGYMLSLLGFMIFALGGGADFAWHTLFGFEADEEALLSPAHLLLATGGVLLTSGPLRAALRRSGLDGDGRWSHLLPALLSLLSVYSLFTFFTQYANAFTHANIIAGRGPDGETYFWNVAGITGVLVPTALMMGFILLAIRRWQLPIGSLTLLLTTNAGLMFSLGSSYSGQYWPVLLAALAGGILADALLALLKPSVARVRALRVFSFATPFSFFLLYFAALILSSGVWWRIHMWLGAPFLAGVVGLALSYLSLPPATEGAPVVADA